MPFSFNSLPTSDAGAPVATAPGQSTAASGLVPQFAMAPSDASFDTCLTQAKLTPGTMPGKMPSTTKAPADAAVSVDASEGESKDPAAVATAPSDAVVDPLASLNSLLGLVVPPPFPAPVAETATPPDAPSDSSLLNGDNAAAGVPLSDANGPATPAGGGNSFFKMTGFSKTCGTPTTVSPDQALTNLPDSRITKGRKTDAKGSLATGLKADAQPEVVTPTLDQPIDAVPTQTSARATPAQGPKGQSSKLLGRMLAVGPCGPALFPAASTSAATTTTADATPISSSVQSLRALMLSQAPLPLVDSVTMGAAINPAAIVSAQTVLAAASAATATVASAPMAATTSNTSAPAPGSARDLLASGAPVLEYFVSPDQTLVVRAPTSARTQKNDVNGTAPEDPQAVFTPTGDMATVVSAVDAGSVPTTLPTSIPLADTAGTPAKGDFAENVIPGTLVPLAVDVAVAQNQTTSGTTLVAPRFDAANAASIGPQAKIAALDDSRVSSLGSGDKSSTRGRKNNALLADDKGVTQSASGVGTDTAKRVLAMPNNNPVNAENARSSDPFLSLAGLSAAASNASNSSAAENAPSNPVLSSHAAQTVREIRDIADGLWAVDRSSVEVRFNFTESDKLSVRVEFKDGAVHTTFRTDSPELRATLAREWQTQTPTAGSDVRPYRVADPVFSGGSSNNDQHSSFTGGDASRQQQQRFFEQSAGSGRHSFASSRSSGSSAVTVPNTAQRTSITDTSIHLNAFA